jgi:hypothetical protein
VQFSLRSDATRTNRGRPKNALGAIRKIHSACRPPTRISFIYISAAKANSRHQRRRRRNKPPPFVSIFALSLAPAAAFIMLKRYAKEDGVEEAFFTRVPSREPFITCFNYFLST